MSSLSLQLPDLHAAVGGSSTLGCAARAGSGSHQVIWMQWERSALAWAWCNSCCAASGQAGKIFTATHVSHPLHVASLAAHLPGHRRQAWGHFLPWKPWGLYFILFYLSCSAPTVGVAFDHENCRRVFMAPKYYQGLSAWWHRHPRFRDREGSQAVSQLTDKDVPSAGGQQPCLRLLPGLPFAFTAEIDEDTPLEHEFLDLFHITFG